METVNRHSLWVGWKELFIYGFCSSWVGLYKDSHGFSLFALGRQANVLFWIECASQEPSRWFLACNRHFNKVQLCINIDKMTNILKAA